MMEDMGSMAGAMTAMMIAGMTLVVVVVTVATVAAVPLLRRRRSPLDDLDRRYARGELTADQYQRRRTDITGERWPAPDWPG